MPAATADEAAYQVSTPTGYTAVILGLGRVLADFGTFLAVLADRGRISPGWGVAEASRAVRDKLVGVVLNLRRPQQAMVPYVRIAHDCQWPAEMTV